MRHASPSVPLPAIVLTVALALGGAGAASAQTLPQNRGFAADLSGWTAFGPGVSATWNAEDADGNPGSGSALIGSAMPSVEVGLRQCVPASAGQLYSFFYRERLAAGLAANGYPAYSFAFYAGGACATPLPSTADVQGGGSAGPEWVVGGYRAGDLPAVTASPAGTGSALVTIEVENRGTGPFPQILFDDAFFGAYSPGTVTIPASASAHGQAGTFFHTDLWILNPSSFLSIQVQARHYCFAGQTCSGGSRTVSVGNRASVLIGDVLANLFDDPGPTGAIELTWDASLGPIQALSRTYSPALPAPTTGSTLPALGTSEARTRALLPGLGSNGGNLQAGFRTNVGAYNPNAASATVTITLYGPVGNPFGSPVVFTLGAHEPAQVNDVFAAAGSPSTVDTNIYAVVRSTLPVFCYATVIDNQSADSVIVPGLPYQTTP